MASPGISLDNAISGLAAGIDQARKVAGQIARDTETKNKEAAEADETVEVSEPEPGKAVGSNIDVMA